MWQPQQMHYGLQQPHAQRPIQPMQPPSASGPPAAVPQRSNKRLAIIDPNTGKEVTVNAKDEPASKDERKDDNPAETVRRDRE